MVTAIIGLSFTLFTMVIGTVVWGIRLEGQVKTQKELSAQQDLFSDKRYVDITERFDRQDSQLKSLGDKLDRVLEVRRG